MMTTTTNEYDHNQYHILDEDDGVISHHLNLQLLESLRHGDIQNVRKLLECGADPDFELFVDQNDSQTVLMEAFKYNQESGSNNQPSPIILLLLSFGANVSKESKGISRQENLNPWKSSVEYPLCPLSVAASLGATDIVRHLILVQGAVASPHLLSFALLKALIGYHKDTVQVLLDIGASLPPLPEDPLHFDDEAVFSFGIHMATACVTGNLVMLCDIAVMIRNLGYNLHFLVNQPIPISPSNETLLQYAIASHQQDIVDYLLTNLGVDPDYSYNGLGDPFIHAVQTGNKTLVDSLLRHNANVNLYDCDGWTPLMYAVRDKHIEIAINLLEHGADYNDIQSCVQLRHHGLIELEPFKKCTAKPDQEIMNSRIQLSPFFSIAILCHLIIRLISFLRIPSCLSNRWFPTTIVSSYQFYNNNVDMSDDEFDESDNF